MKIILLKDVKAQGKQGDVIEVSDGYGRNFLIRQGLGKIATPEICKQVETEKAKEKERKIQEKADAEALAKSFEGKKVHISAKKGENGRLFGSVTSQEIADAINKLGYSIDKKDVSLPSPIKQIGEYKITVRLYAETFATILVVVE